MTIETRAIGKYDAGLMRAPSRHSLVTGFLRHNLRLWLGARVMRRLPVRPANVPHPIRKELFGVCVAVSDEPGSAQYVIARLRDLGVSHVRVDICPRNNTSVTGSFLKSLRDGGFTICLHPVQPLEQAQRMPDDRACAEWRVFLRDVLDKHGAACDCVEIGATCNRRRWAGHSPEGFRALWLIGHEEAAARGITLAGPNVTDFEPVYNAGILGLMSGNDCPPAIHTDNLFVERAGEPEAFDHKILGRTLAPLLRMNTVRKAHLLSRIGKAFGVQRMFCSHVTWSLRRIDRILANVEEKQADYLARYYCLLAAAGTPERIYWGPLIGQREGLIDDGTTEYPDIPHVTFYGAARGRIADYRVRPAFDALRTVVAMLADSTFEETHSSAKGLEIHAFRSNESLVHVVWTTNGNCAEPSDLYDDADLRNAHAFSRDGSRLGSVPSLFTESPVYLVWNASARVIVKAGASVIESVRVHAPGARSLVFRKTSRSFGLSPVNMPHAYSPEALDASGDAVVLRDRRNKVWHLPDPSGGGGRLVVKRVRIAGAHKRLIQRWRPGRALMSWNGAQELLRRGIPTPAPVAFDQPHDKLKDGHYVCRYVTPDASMRQVFEGLKRGRKHFLRIDDSTWYQSLAEFISNMHRRGVYFRDLSPGNILVVRRDDGCPGFTLIDTARARFHSHAVSAACRLRDLRRALHPLHWAGRKRFLAIYAEHSGMKYSAAMLWPLLRYDIKHYLKDRIRGRRPWFGPLPEDGLWKANLPRGERTHEEPGRDTAFIRTVRSLLDRPVIRAGGALAIALACWTGPSRFSHFLVAVGLAAAALLVKPKGFRVWKSPVGPAMAAVYLVPLLLLPLGVAPGVSGREMAKLLPLVAAGLAIPVLFNSPPAAGAAMSWSACAATLYLGIDLIRLAIQVGPAMTDARYAEPYLMIHPNVSSIMAAAAFFVLSARAWSWRKRPALAAAAALGAAVDLAYLLAMASRGPQLAFALACAAFVAVLPTTRQKLVWALILATGISICASQMERINPRFAEGDVFSLNERTTVWRHAWSLAKAHPVIGYGYGKKVFQRVYYGSNPPEAGFEFPHPHNYWLKVLFESGWVGVTCHLLLWTAVISVLLRRLRRERTLDGRLWPGTVFLLAVLLIAYGLGDFPDNMAKVLMMWIPGLALAAAGPVQPTRPG